MVRFEAISHLLIERGAGWHEEMSDQLCPPYDLPPEFECLFALLRRFGIFDVFVHPGGHFPGHVHDRFAGAVAVALVRRRGLCSIVAPSLYPVIQRCCK